MVEDEWVFDSGTTTMRTVHVRIEGRVQGVGYRAWTHRVAADLGLSGWVRNRFDGSVEAIFQGPSEAVGVMLDRCAVGPSGALVTNVEVVGEGVGVFEGFDVRPTA
jgi:acylphosphatase